MRVWKKGARGNRLLGKRWKTTVYGMVMASESPIQGLPQG
jgi:hypothetical protein